ncbi:MAG: glycosyltransferase family 2 protein [Atopobiaceae bacterium]|nr:glycosyltransferase family 2 protein [Atopobiaceae bacterium]
MAWEILDTSPESQGLPAEGHAPTVSVIVPVYNQAQYLPDAVESILHQDFQDFELILVDDGSTDGSGELCDGFAEQDARIRVIHQDNAGLSAARYAGLEVSRGGWIAFVDSDDLICSSYLRILLDTALGHGVDIVASRILGFTTVVTASAEGKNLDSGTSASGPNADAADSSASAPIVEDIRFVSGRDACARIYKTKGFILDAAWGKLYARRLFDTLRFPIGKTYEDAAISHELLYPQERIALRGGIFYAYRNNPDGIKARPLGPGSFDVLEALEARISFYERMGESELVEATRRYFELQQATLNAKATLAGNERMVPEQWRMSAATQLNVLGDHHGDPSVAPLFIKMVEWARSHGR